jgi:hypothetical protein
MNILHVQERREVLNDRNYRSYFNDTLMTEITVARLIDHGQLTGYLNN